MCQATSGNAPEEAQATEKGGDEASDLGGRARLVVGWTPGDEIRGSPPARSPGEGAAEQAHPAGTALKLRVALCT